jgi:hypothetical protein
MSLQNQPPGQIANREWPPFEGAKGGAKGSLGIGCPAEVLHLL